MKKYLIIYKSKENEEIRSTNILPQVIKRNGEEITVDQAFLDKYVSEYEDEYQTASYIELTEELAEIITFLCKNRTRSINEHLAALKEILDTLGEIQDDVYHTLSNLKVDFKKQLENENQKG